jgi:paraquat-inducible protein B
LVDTDATMTSDHVNATMILDTVLAFDIIVVFVIIPLVTLLMSSTLMWRKEHHRNESVFLSFNAIWSEVLKPSSNKPQIN